MLPTELYLLSSNPVRFETLLTYQIRPCLSTDEFGFRAERDRTSVHDLHATMLHTLGLDHEKLTYRYGGRDFRLTDVHGRVLTEILA